MNFRFATLLTTTALVIASPIRAETAEEVIAKARAYLGSDAALSSVTTVRFSGVLESTQPNATGDTAQSQRVEAMPVEIVFQKPYQQLMTVKRPGSTDAMVLDDYEGWSKSTSNQNAKQWRVTLLDTEQIKQLRANTWENLNFFYGLEKKGGTVQLGDETNVDGVACVKLSFIHSDRIVFHRYFNKTSGRLVKTETSNGSEIREEGELTVDGIRFPKKIINKAPSGYTTTIVFETVVLNQRVSPAEFAVPSLHAD